MEIVVLSAVVGTVIQNVVKAGIKWAYTRFEDRVEGEMLERDRVKAIETRDVGPFIEKYKDHLSEEDIAKVHSVVRLRDLFEETQRRINQRKYSEKAADIFIKLAKALDEVPDEFLSIEAGIKEMHVQDAEAEEELPVASVNYIVALLLRFAAGVWTQLAMKLTPSMKGWALEYDAKIRLVVVPPSGTRGRGERVDTEFHKFHNAYLKVMEFYRDGMKIRDLYLKAVACLKTAQWKVRIIQDQQQIHRHMNPDHLAGLSLGFRAEAQFWQFNISEKLPDVVTTVRTVVDDDKKLVKRYMRKMGVKKEDYNELMKCLGFYEHIGDGLAGALKLYKEANSKCKPGKHKEQLELRIADIKDRASTNPDVSVPDPEPVL